MLCIAFLELIYLIAGSLYLLATFIQFRILLPPAPTSDNHKSDLFFCEFLKNNWPALVRRGNGNPLQYSCLEYPMDGGAQ